MGPQPGHGAPATPALAGPLAGLGAGPAIHQARVGPAAGLPLWSETFQTTLEDANLVGNVYFANYFAWQNRVLDLFLHHVAPGCHRGIGAEGELLTLHTHVDYLREAMPFDRVQVDLHLRSLSRKGALFGFDYFRLGAGGSRQKLSAGTQQVAWVRRNPAGTPEPENWPGVIQDALLANPTAPPLPTGEPQSTGAALAEF
jgi:acyl-CoA thioesterase FadM